MIKKVIERNYYNDEKGEMSLLYKSLVCNEKIEYILLNDYKYLYNYFCDDINIEFINKNGNGFISITNLEKRETFYNEKIINLSLENSIEFLEENLRKGQFIAIQTRFDMLPDYYWFYEERGEVYSSGHWFLAVGIDEQYLYYIEDPAVLKNVKRLEYNEQIFMLNKKEFYKALEFKRNFKIYIRKQVDNGYKIDIIPRIKEMVKRYYSSERKEYTEGKTYFGQIAYKEIIKYFDKNDMFSDMAAATEWKIHIIGARHYILKKCFNDLFPYRNDILEQLDDLTMEWTILKGIIMKQSITDRAYRENIQLRFKSIFTKEEKLFENLSDFCK